MPVHPSYNTLNGALLIANRGEIAIRIARTANAIGLRTVAVYSEDEAQCLHTRACDTAVPLTGSGPAPYLDIDQIIEAAMANDCRYIHPGYGFLSENRHFAKQCKKAGLTFVGPRIETLDLFGDKSKARSFAAKCGVPIIPGTKGSTPVEHAQAFHASLGPRAAVMVKAIGGGGGRGMRVVHDPADLADAWKQCAAEAKAGTGRSEVYVERYFANARHIEIQIAGDGTGSVTHLWERDCTIQRRHQKLIEIAPAPGLDPSIRAALIEAAIKMAREANYLGLGTFEFLVAGDDYAFIETNPRIQVEHTVTEEITGLDLVAAQLRLAAGASLEEAGIDQKSIPEPNGCAVQARINTETITSDGMLRPSAGALTAFEPPADEHIRVDTLAHPGCETNPRFDSLLAKLIVRAHDFQAALQQLDTTLGQFRIDGVATNIALLRRILNHEEFVAYNLHTTWFDEHLPELADAPDTEQKIAGARVDATDPLAVLDHGRGSTQSTGPATSFQSDPEGIRTVRAPIQGTIAQLDISEGDAIKAGGQLLVLEAMKMQYPLKAERGGIVKRIDVSVGDTVYENTPLLIIEESDTGESHLADEEVYDLDYIRDDLKEVLERHALGHDAARTEAVEKRHARGYRTARENLADLVDPDSFIEYGALVIAAQRTRRDIDDLIRNTPADGLIAGLGRINGAHFDNDRARCCIVSYDYMVLAGTQGKKNHEKKDRMFELAREWRLPVVLFAEGGGGRPGDTDAQSVAGLNCLAFNYFAQLSGLVPLVGITTGRCFAGNAVLLGCCDVVIAAGEANIGVGGPAMIEGGGLGVFRPEEVGPMDVQVPNGVVDIHVPDEAAAVAVTRKYLAYFQGPIEKWDCADQRILRHLIPENRLHIYDIRKVIETLADTDSVLEIRRHWGHGIVTSLIRIEGRPVGVVANNPAHLAGAIDSDGADKGARFMQLCDAFDIPIVFLCDCPGIMVGPESEKTALVRHAARMFVIGASITVPCVTIVLRKAYGLGAQAMAGGSFSTPLFTIAWPTGEFGGMGLEGAVKLGFRKELEAVKDPAERKALYDKMVAAAYERGKATNTASHFELDDVIDPKVSRYWIMNALRATPPPPERTTKKRPCVDTW